MRTLVTAGLLTLGVLLSLASGGPILTGSNCCVCLDEKSCLPVDSNACADQMGEQIGGAGTKVEVKRADCPGLCDECKDFEFEVVE